MYADDTHLTFASNNITEIENYLNVDLANVSEWLIANKLTLNHSKTEFMLIGSQQRLSRLPNIPTVSMNGAPLKQVPHSQSLGVYIEQNLTWSEHIQ